MPTNERGPLRDPFALLPGSVLNENNESKGNPKMNVCSLNERERERERERIMVVMCRVAHFCVTKIMKLGRTDVGIAGYRSNGV